MLLLSPNYLLANAQRPRRPRHVIALSFDIGNTDIVYFTSHADAATPDGAVVIPGVVRDVSVTTHKIDFFRGQSTISRLTFELVDVDGEISALLADRLSGGDSLRKKRGIYYKGFAGLDFEDYVKVQTFIVHNISQSNNTYRFELDDIQREEKREICVNQETTLSKTITDSQMHIPITVADASKFPTIEHDDSYTDRPGETVGYAKIENQNGFEIVCHSGIFTHATDGLSLQVVTTGTNNTGRGALNTVAQGVQVDLTKPEDRRPKVTEFIYLEGPALKILYAIQTGKLYGQDPATLPDHWHLGIDEGYIALSEYENAGPDIWDPANNTGRMVRFLGLEKQNGKQFIEDQILSWLVAATPVRPTGALGFRRADPVLSDGGYVGHITQSQIVSFPTLTHDLTSVVNRLRVRWNHNHVKDDFTKTHVAIDEDSIAVYQDADLREFELFGVHTGQHTDEDLGNYFNTWRDRFAGAPLSGQIIVLPSVNQYEPGDPVRISTTVVRDPTTGQDLDRVFEILSSSENPVNGHMTYDVFASTQRAGAILPPEFASVLNDAAYVKGTLLSTVLTISGGVITTNGHLDAGTYHYLGDLELAPGVTVTWDGHVNLWIRGHFEINGKLDGEGAGLPGGQWGDTGSFSLNEAEAGQVGLLGATKQQSGLEVQSANNGSSHFGVDHRISSGYGISAFPFMNVILPVVGKYNALPFFTLKNLGDDLEGLPENLFGSSGSTGLPSYSIPGFPAPSASGVGYGGDGGNGGASMTIISRGGSHGAAGEIDTSGADGQPGGLRTFEGADYAGGTGAGGAPGGVLWLMDGDHTPPDLAAHHTANTGDTAPQGTQHELFMAQWVPILTGQTRSGPNGFRTRDMRVAASAVQYIPLQHAPVEEVDPPPADVQNFVARQVGALVNFSWDRGRDADRAGFTIKFGPVGTLWEGMSFLTEETRGTRISNAHVPPGTWDFAIKQKDYQGNESENAAYYTLTVTSGYDIIDEVQHNPAWAGATLTNFGVHCSGKLYPKSGGVGADFGWEAFTEYVPERLSEYRVDLPEYVLAFDDLVRPWVEYSVSAGPGETGNPNFSVDIDYHLDGGSYDGWEPWVVGELATRNTKFRFTMGSGVDDAMCYIGAIKTVVDTIEESLEYDDFTVEAGGTTIVYSSPFHEPPTVDITVQGSSPRFATYDGKTETQCTIYLFNGASVDVGGTAKITFTGNLKRL